MTPEQHAKLLNNIYCTLMDIRSTQMFFLSGIMVLLIIDSFRRNK